jgi:hypothetical protein
LQERAFIDALQEGVFNMKSIIAVLMALFCIVGFAGIGAAYGGDHNTPNVSPVVVKPVYTPAAYTNPQAAGTWLQDEAFLANSGMEYATYDMGDSGILIAVQTQGLDATTMEQFAKESIQKTGATAVYFEDARTVYLADGTVKTNAKLDLHNQPAIERALKTLF